MARSTSRRTLLKAFGAVVAGSALARFGRPGAPAATAAAVPYPPANDHFKKVWERTDKPVAEGKVVRPWMWGPAANTSALTEPYTEAPNHNRQVQYYDKL